MQTITPKNWAAFQHYKDRSPAWIKLHRGILDDFDFHCLHDASKALAPLLWLLASEYEGGQIPFDIERIAFRMRMSKEKLAESVKPLIDKGFFVLSQGASDLLAECLPRGEKEVEKEREVEREESAPAKPLPAKKQDRGTSLPKDWEPTDVEIAFCREERPDLTPHDVASRFKDYWASKPGTAGRKTDWSATWRNWVRNERQQRQSGFRTKADEWTSTINEFLGGSKPDDPFTIEMDV